MRRGETGGKRAALKDAAEGGNACCAAFDRAPRSPSPAPCNSSPVCVRIRVRGQVQGVGFRPFVYRLAAELGVNGWVRNDADGVEIEAQGGDAAMEALQRRLKNEAPALARVDEVSAVPAPAVPGRLDFIILESRPGRAHTGIAPDTALCQDCLAELFDPYDRRYRYAFTNCTNCGPRYTITRRLPYDRPNTSMARFTLCPACHSEYQDPLDRRFHAQPNACPVCGPKLTLLDKNRGSSAGVADPLAATVERLRAGQIVAIKGLGGFHLMCDARNQEAVARLRQRKHREEKPLAVMLAGIASIEPFAECDAAERKLLESRERPIVLLEKRAACDAALPGVAPGMNELGVLLPYAPLHYLLFHEAAGRPAGTAWLDEPQPFALVCTSANSSDEPLVTANADALTRLTDIADAFLLLDRDILVRCDDSVVRCEKHPRADVDLTAPHLPLTGHPNFQFIRRARGYTPRAIKLAQTGPSVLAIGGWFKNTICLTRGNEAFLSQHIGDLDNAATCRSMEETVRHLISVLEIEPQIVAHDRHPDFFSTRHALELARQRGIPSLAVQHHHAHIAAVMAEHGLSGPVLGVALDGVGLGTDGTAWGGELLRVEGATFERLGHLSPLALPGGDRAAREPWRMAASALHALGRNDEIEPRFAPGSDDAENAAAAAVAQILKRKFNCPTTSSCGRLFDAAAGLLKVREVAAFEGQAAMLLEGLAARHGPVAPLEEGYLLEGGGRLSLLPLLAAVSEIRDAGYGAALFHATLAEAMAAWIAAASAEAGLRTVVFGGGCFLNRLLSTDLAARLTLSGMSVYQARQAPTNDGGLSLGQAWVAMQNSS